MGTSFDSFFQAGFECSSQRRKDGVRLDLIKATGHDKHVLQDYRLCRELGLNMVRASTASTHPVFVKMIRELILERLEPDREKRFLGAI